MGARVSVEHEAPYSRMIRSFVRREGRLTPGQARALERSWPRYGVSGLPAEPGTLWTERKPCVLEIGFGNGEALFARAQAEPHRHFIGAEVHRPGVGHLLRLLAEGGVENVRVTTDDAVMVVAGLADAVLSEVDVWFPDPWPKKRHHKRRLIQGSFVMELARVVADGGILHLATDVADYAEAMRAAVAGTGTWSLVDERRASRPITRFEERGLSAGRAVTDLRYRRTG